VIFVCVTFQRETKISLFLAATSLSLDKIFFFLLAAVEKKDRPASSKRGQKDQNQKEPPFVMSEKVILV
jgi:hypothetical protein